MDIRQRLNEKGLYRVVNAAVLACMGLFFFGQYLGISAVTRLNILVLAAVLALFVGIDHLPVKGKIFCLLTVFVCLCTAVAVTGLETSLAFWHAYFQWCLGYASTPMEWLAGYHLVQTAVIAAGAYLVQVVLEKIKYIKIGLAFACAIAMLVCLFARTPPPHLGVAFVLLYLVTVCLEWLQERWEKKKSGSREARLLWLFPFLAVYLLLMAVMPAPEEPYDWLWVKNIYDQIKESFQAISQSLWHGGREDFDMALSGFSENGELGGGIQQDDRETMRIHVQNHLVKSVYLIGRVYDTFDGRQWVQEYLGNEGERFIDSMETLYAVRRVEDRPLRDYLLETDMRVEYGSFHTRYVFTPLKIRRIQDDKGMPDLSFEGGDIVFNKQKGYGTEYNVKYDQLNVGEELFDRLLETQQETDEALWDVIARTYEKEMGQRITLDMLEAHSRGIYENYLDPVTLSDEAESYLAKITDGAETNLEKLRAIERELSSFIYTRTPGELPDSIITAGEFLDYFLLESRQGYCVHFATAFVLLARAEGIPARYVQGFCVPLGEDGTAAVLSSMAHSWPEVYMEGVGWIPFEPTPGYDRLRYTPWKVSELNVPSASEEEAQHKEESDLGSPDAEKEMTEEAVESDVEESDDEEGIERLLKPLLFSILAILAGYALVLAADNLLGMYRYGKMSHEERLKVEVRRNLRLLSWIGLQRQEQETLQELRERGMQMGMSLGFIEDYENVLYGGKKVGEETVREAEKARKQLLANIRQESRRKYVFYGMRLLMARYR